MDTLKGYYTTIMDAGCQTLVRIQETNFVDAVNQINGTVCEMAKTSYANSSETFQLVIDKLQNIWQAMAPWVQTGQSIVVSNLGISTISLLTGLIVLGIAQSIESKSVAAAMTVGAVTLAVFAGILLVGTPAIPMPLMISMV